MRHTRQQHAKLWSLLLCVLAVLFSLQAKASVYQPFHSQPTQVTCSKLKPMAATVVPEPRLETTRALRAPSVALNRPKPFEPPHAELNESVLPRLTEATANALFFRPPPVS